MIISKKNNSPYIFKIKNELEIIVIDYNKYIKNKKENKNISQLRLYKKEIINFDSLFILLNYLIFNLIKIIIFIIYYFKYYN